MATDNLSQLASIRLTAGHLLVIWDILANKVMEAGLIDAISEEERRAIWALQDLCEESLTELGISARPEAEWEALMAAAREHVKTVPAEFLD